MYAIEQTRRVLPSPTEYLTNTFY